MSVYVCTSEEKVSKRVKFNMEKDTGVFLLRGPRFEMEPVYNGTIFNSTLKVQLYGSFTVLNSRIPFLEFIF
jgi:hypothetical protein